jgi:hypothetical protein
VAKPQCSVVLSVSAPGNGAIERALVASWFAGVLGIAVPEFGHEELPQELIRCCSAAGAALATASLATSVHRRRPWWIKPPSHPTDRQGDVEHRCNLSAIGVQVCCDAQ